MFTLHRYIFSVFWIYHICSAQIGDIHDLIFEVWDIPILFSTGWRYPWFNFWKLGYPQPGLHWLEISMVYLCSKQINMGYKWDILDLNKHQTWRLHLLLRRCPAPLLVDDAALNDSPHAAVTVMAAGEQQRSGVSAAAPPPPNEKSRPLL